MESRFGLLLVLLLTLILPPAALILAQQAGEGRNAVPPRPRGPGDIYTAAGFPVVSAHSTTRALYASYNGPLYQVMRQSDGKTLDVGVVQPSPSPMPDGGGYANAVAQDSFCADTICVISRIYDQSGKGNHLYQAPPGTFSGPAKGGFNTLPIADMAPITISGHKAYGVYIIPGMGLRNNDATGAAVNDEPQGIYMVFDGSHYDNGCCFNYGNTSTNSRAVGRGTMETVYFGTATAWGRGSGPGPWIMSDMEAGLFSGYDARLNEGSPTIDSWRFVTGVMNGGGGNQWDLRGGNAQEGGLTTFYSGIRPGSRENENYFPMHRKGAVQMGNGGDNGNGSAGTFYEGIVTTGYPTDFAIDAVQANIVAAKYDLQRVSLSRVTTFTPSSTQEVTAAFKNTTGAPVAGAKLSISLPAAWTSVVSGTSESTKTFTDTVEPGATVSATFTVTSPATSSAGHLIGKAEWTNPTTRASHFDTSSRRVRNAYPIKINEVQFSAGANVSSQFIELYNIGDSEFDISNWSIINTQSQWAPVKLVTIPVATRLAGGTHYLLGLSNSGLVARANAGEKVVNVRSITGFEPGQQIVIGGEAHKINSVGTAAAAATTIFIPVSTGPWIEIPAGATNLPVTNSEGFAVGEKIGIDVGGNYEIATVNAVGKGATQTTLSRAVTAGSTNISVEAGTNISAGDSLTLDTGGRKEIVTVKRVTAVPASDATPIGAEPVRGRRGRGGGGNSGANIELAAPLQMDHMANVDLSDVGTGISFSPPTKFPHISGDAVQALGSGVTLDSALANNQPYGAAVINPQATTEGYQGPPAPNQWFGGALSANAGSIALMDASGEVVVDAVVYGSQQSSSSANGTIASPELATLEGDQGKGGCIVVVPNVGGRGRGRGRGAPSAGAPAPSRSAGRTSDGADTDNNCTDFRLQVPTPGAPNQNPQ